ncbi:DMT family transporter [Pandoraea pulmonicola]|uniref:DMT family transporter n=1 Tax=Pandoraea pulmonicola TaxID=93221 RepID=UPI001C3F6193|nr:SMR family transporter [Pandoraea pulmonicola]
MEHRWRSVEVRRRRSDRAELPEHVSACSGHADDSPGTAYAIWTGLGAAGVAIGSCLIFKQNISITQLAFIALIVVGVAGTKIFSQA